MATASPEWSLQCDYLESCNCDFGCSCNFSGFPNFGRCETLHGLHIRSGNYGETRLDGLDFVYTASWPKAIHQGNGTMRVYIDQRASDEQRAAIMQIAYGRAGGSGYFKIFAATFTYQLEPEFVPEMKVDGSRSSFKVPGVLEVQLAPRLDPVSGGEHEVQVNVPTGFIFQTAHAVKTVAMRILSPNLNFDHSGRNAFYTVVSYKGPCL
jgi:hypothetical protein